MRNTFTITGAAVLAASFLGFSLPAFATILPTPSDNPPTPNNLYLALSVDECVRECQNDVIRRGGIDSGLMRRCADQCMDRSDREEARQQAQAKMEYEQQLKSEEIRLRQEKNQKEMEEWDKEYQRQQLEKKAAQTQQNFDDFLRSLQEKLRCPPNSRGLTAQEKIENPGIKCFCMDGYRVGDDGRSCINDKIPQAQPVNTPSCPPHSSPSSYGDGCPCDRGYEPDASQTQCVKTPASTPKPTSSCPANAVLAGNTCSCKNGYELNTKRTGCEKKQNSATGIDVLGAYAKRAATAERKKQMREERKRRYGSR